MAVARLLSFEACFPLPTTRARLGGVGALAWQGQRQGTKRTVTSRHALVRSSSPSMAAQNMTQSLNLSGALRTWPQMEPRRNLPAVAAGTGAFSLKPFGTPVRNHRTGPVRNHRTGITLTSSPLRPGPLRAQAQEAAVSTNQAVEAPAQLDSHDFFVTCHPGLESLVASELQSPLIGAQGVEPGKAGVSFRGSLATGYRANLWLRSAIRVLVKLASAPLSPRQPAGDALYTFIRQAAPWEDLIQDPRHEGRGGRGLSQTFGVVSKIGKSGNGLTNSQFASVRAKDAVCDAIRDAYGGAKPPVPTPDDGPDLPLFLTVYRERATLYRDMSGQSLHKRGYRSVMHKASLNESVAAAVLICAGWDKASLPSTSSSAIILDPMCGSGTLLIEAALMATRTAPGIFRKLWPFQTWHDFEPGQWDACVSEALQERQPCPDGIRFLGNEIHPGALSLCRKDAEEAGVLDLLELSCRDCREYEPPTTPSLVVVNPPWGDRLGGSSEEDENWLKDTWHALGQHLRSHCPGAEVFLVSGNADVTQKLFMKSSARWPLVVGGTECRILQYHVRSKSKVPVLK